MVRAGHLKSALVLIAVALATPAAAEKAIDWYADLKREAKYARIASTQGARLPQIQPFIDAVEKLEARVFQWDQAEEPKLASRLCLTAAMELRVALYKGRPEDRVEAIVANEPKREACLAKIQGH